jgi:hypothetical protein
MSRTPFPVSADVDAGRIETSSAVAKAVIGNRTARPPWAPPRQILPAARRSRNGSLIGALKNVRDDQHEGDGEDCRHGEQDSQPDVEHKLATIVRSHFAHTPACRTDTYCVSGSLDSALSKLRKV